MTKAEAALKDLSRGYPIKVIKEHGGYYLQLRGQTLIETNEGGVVTYAIDLSNAECVP